MWVITKDLINVPHPALPEELTRSAVGVGSGDYDGRKLPYRFKMYDDDCVLYYEGRSDDRESEKAFDPLWNFGMADSVYFINLFESEVAMKESITDKCPSCGKFVDIDEAYYVKERAEYDDGYVLPCCNEKCGIKYLKQHDKTL
jgi:hypothetical protein